MVVARSVCALLAVFVGTQLPVAKSQVCGPCPNLVELPEGYSNTTYVASDAGVINPERGGAVLLISHATSPVSLTNPSLVVYRQQQNINLIWRLWYLDCFLTSDISASFLSHIDSDFDVLRGAGFKATIRFAYTDNQTAAVSDAAPVQMLAHIAQLKPLLQKHEDVILSVQMGFIGVWGEWHYTTNFGDQGNVSPADLVNRRSIVDALLDAVPTSRSLHIRTPALKQSITGQSTAVTAVDYGNSNNPASRIGHHNDCFLASSTDFGTYSDVSSEYAYLAADTQYVSMGGETCTLNPPRSECTTAKSELAMFHWSFLNIAYRLEVLDGWKTEGCYDEILNNLGYRLRLVSAVIPTMVSSGSDACFLIKFVNVGYAAPMNSHQVKLILRGSSTTYASGHIAEFSTAEPWSPESGTISVSFSLSMNVPAGQYEVLLELSDPLASLSGNPDYSILFLNSGVPENSTALNNLQHVTMVTPSSGSGSCPGLTSRPDITKSTFRCYSGCEDLFPL